MTAGTIHLDPDLIHPVIDDEWHRLKDGTTPQTGDTVEMLCGVTATIGYEPLAHRRRDRPPTCCPACDAITRKRQGIPRRRGDR
ncbi:hypothetical protein [Amycolatopsis eburnea]|uniref:DUF3039 domain-containing protein n=1 Tax=Amycolatopsis eburnea TaxID=2267691 RepID=A0A3R9FVV6_9PSEU|nr:hypothetical protein [Amycolatopsis eburnea]RSD26333.1 hypothetical protein EIY87_00270 [Amycolatopsis eburnea]